MAWVSVDQRIRDHRKIRALHRLLDISKAAAIGHLVLIWTWALDNVDRDGRVLTATAEDIEEASCWKGDEGNLYDALVATQWIDERDDGIFIHDWEDFNKPFYKFIERKENDKLRKRNKKIAGQSAESDCDDSAGKSAEIPWKVYGESLESREEFHDSPSPSPSPSPCNTILNHVPRSTSEHVFHDIQDKQSSLNSKDHVNHGSSYNMETPVVKKRAKKLTDDELPSDFLRFYNNYIRPEEKRRTFNNWNARLNSGYTAVEIITAADRYTDYHRKLGTEIRFTKVSANFISIDFMTFLEWKDDIPRIEKMKMKEAEKKKETPVEGAMRIYQEMIDKKERMYDNGEQCESETYDGDDCITSTATDVLS